MVKLEPKQYLQRYPRELSGGQQQRVGVIRALAADAPLLLMDEPFGAVDPINRESIQNEFFEMQRKLGMTVIMVSHDIDEAIKLGDKVAVFKSGRLLQYDHRTPCWRTRRTSSSAPSPARTARSSACSWCAPKTPPTAAWSPPGRRPRWPRRWN